MASAWKWFSDIFWSEHLWLRRGVKWTDVANRYPGIDIFLYIIPLIVIVLIIRHVLINYCFLAIGRTIGLKDKKQRMSTNVPLLEAAYRKSPLKKDAILLAKQLDMSEREVERWWRRRMSADQPSILSKFCKHAWKTTFLVFNCSVSWYASWDKGYLWDVEKIFEGNSHQDLTNAVWWLYSINVAHAVSSIITIFTDERQSDSRVMLFHHVIVFLIYTANIVTCAFYAGYYYRTGVALTFILDISILPLEMGKTLKLAKYEAASKIIFSIFAIVWFYTRMYVFTKMFTSELSKENSLHRFFLVKFLVFLLLMLLLLHVYWSVIIIKITYHSLFTGSLHDIISSESNSSDSQLSDSRAPNAQKPLSVYGVSFFQRRQSRAK